MAGLVTMPSTVWFKITVVLAGALIAAVLLLPPWSPLRVTESNHGAAPPAVVATATPTIVPLPSPPLAQPQPPPAPSNPAATSTPLPAAPEPTPAAFSSTDVEGLIKATEDPDWGTRWDAVNALGERKDPRGIPALVKRALYDDNPHPRWRALWAISSVELSGGSAIPLLREGLKGTDAVAVRNAAVALAFFSQQEAAPELLSGLKDPDDFRRWEAVFSLRNVPDASVRIALIPLLDPQAERDHSVRGEMALALGAIGGEGAGAALLKALRSDPSPQVRWRAAAGLARMGDGSVTGELEKVLLTEQDQQVTDAVRDALAQFRKR